MKTKKNSENETTLTNENKPLNLEQTNNSTKREALKLQLKSLMKIAKQEYLKVYKENEDNEQLDIKAFSACKEKFQKIKSIIEENLTLTTSESIKIFYYDAWISALYADVNALNLNLETEEQLNEVNLKITGIHTRFNALLTKKEKSSSDLNLPTSLISYINRFKET